MLKSYPVINYNNNKIIDISQRFFITNIENEKSKNIYFWHTIKGWKSPENIAYDFYGSCDYVWIILTINNIVNPFEDWLMSENEFMNYVREKYGDNMYDTHHYEIDDVLYPVDPLIPNRKARKISNLEYENRINEKRRRIKVVYPDLLSVIETEAKAMLV